MVSYRKIVFYKLLYIFSLTGYIITLAFIESTLWRLIAFCVAFMAVIGWFVFCYYPHRHRRYRNGLRFRIYADYACCCHYCGELVEYAK